MKARKTEKIRRMHQEVSDLRAMVSELGAENERLTAHVSNLEGDLDNQIQIEKNLQTLNKGKDLVIAVQRQYLQRAFQVEQEEA